MKIIIVPALIKWTVLYFVFFATMCYQTNSLIVKRTVSVGKAEDPCVWEDDCTIKCLPVTSYSLFPFIALLESFYVNHDECHTNGVKVILPSIFIFNMKPDWFSPNIKIFELDIDLIRVSEIAKNAFESEKFSTVKKLTIHNLYLYDLKSWTFLGLTSLEHLVLNDVTISAFANIDSGVLAFANQTLKSFELIENIESKNISINNFLGDDLEVLLSNVEYVKIQYNLSSIDYMSFTAIPNVRELDLSDCQISYVGADSFENFGTNLQLLNLERNKIKTLSENIFAHLITTMSAAARELDNGSLIIRLSGNPWHCDCSLEDLKYLLGNFSNFDGDMLCDTPEEIQNYRIRETQFCPEPITTTESTTSEESPTREEENTSDPTESSPDSIEKECSSSNVVDTKKKILIKSALQQTYLSNISDEIVVFIEYGTPDLVLIWFSSDKISDKLPEYQQKEIIDCASHLTKEIVIKNLEEKTVYTFCLMSTNHSTVSLLDCISYYHQGPQKQCKFWLLDSSRPLVISVVVICLTGSGIVGIVIGFRMAWLFSNSNDTSSIQEDAINHVASHRRNESQQLPVNGEQKYMSGFGSISMSIIEPGAFDNSPPLRPPVPSPSVPPPIPPHPKWMGLDEDDDHYYATVKYNH